MDKFRVETIAATSNPQQLVWAAMHQDYSEDFVWDKKDKFPDETKAGELIVKHLLAGNRGHYGCIEHPQITFNVGYFPHSMMQQVRTHRVGISFDVQCLSGDTEITFVKTSGQLKKIKISELYDLWVNGEKATCERKIKGRNGEPPGIYRINCRKRLQKMRLRVLNESTNTFETSQITQVMCSGIQPVYRLTLEDGKTLDCTTNHKLLTLDGWQRMSEATGLITASDRRAIGTTKDCFVLCNGLTIAGNGLYQEQKWLQQQIERKKTVAEIAQLAQCSDTTIRYWISKYGLNFNTKDIKYRQEAKPCNYNPNALYREKNWLQQQLEADFSANFQPILESTNWNAKPKPPGRKLKAHPVKVTKVEYLGLQVTYDLEVNDPWHNFVANGVVVHNSFRYTGSRIVDVVEGKRNVEDVFYLRPVDNYTNRQGKSYFYSEQQRQKDLEWCLEACKLYQQRVNEGLSEEHARSLIPFDARQNFVMSCNARSLMHLLDLRWKKDAQLEAQKLCELLYIRFEEWMPALAHWYRENRAQKARLSP